MTEYIVAFVTTSGMAEARRIAQALVAEHLAACVNVIPQVESFYWWNDAVQNDPEAKLVIKTRRELCEALIVRVRELHNYEVCEVTCVPIIAGNPAYLDWIASSTLLPVQAGYTSSSR